MAFASEANNPLARLICEQISPLARSGPIRQLSPVKRDGQGERMSKLLPDGLNRAGALGRYARHRQGGPMLPRQPLMPVLEEGVLPGSGIAARGRMSVRPVLERRE